MFEKLIFIKNFRFGYANLENFCYKNLLRVWVPKIFLFFIYFLLTKCT